jgi:hypothetical protein
MIHLPAGPRGIYSPGLGQVFNSTTQARVHGSAHAQHAAAKRRCAVWLLLLLPTVLLLLVATSRDTSKDWHADAMVETASNKYDHVVFSTARSQLPTHGAFPSKPHT